MPTPPAVWPNGSGVIARPETDGESVEIGRAVSEGSQWRAWRLTADGYKDGGLHESHVAAVTSLPSVHLKTIGRVSAGADDSGEDVRAKKRQRKHAVGDKRLLKDLLADRE
jgi:hypothetical protein